MFGPPQNTSPPPVSHRFLQVLDSHPLTMVGVDFNEKARIATACNLDAHAVPHRVVSGDIGKPSALMAQLKRKKVGMVGMG